MVNPGRWKDAEYQGDALSTHPCPWWYSERGAMGVCELTGKEAHFSCKSGCKMPFEKEGAELRGKLTLGERLERAETLNRELVEALESIHADLTRTICTCTQRDVCSVCRVRDKVVNVLDKVKEDISWDD
jgi:hypothetical protein